VVTLNAQGVVEHLLEDLGHEVTIETEFSAERNALGKKSLLPILIADEVALGLLGANDVLDDFASPSERLEQRPVDVVQPLSQIVEGSRRIDGVRHGPFSA